jgi:hypothetical protein
LANLSENLSKIGRRQVREKKKAFLPIISNLFIAKQTNKQTIKQKDLLENNNSLIVWVKVSTKPLIPSLVSFTVYE